MRKSLYYKIMDSLMSKHSPELEDKVPDNQDPEAKFCLCDCPHSDKPCKGTCKEIEQYIKQNKNK